MRVKTSKRVRETTSKVTHLLSRRRPLYIIIHFLNINNSFSCKLLLYYCIDDICIFIRINEITLVNFGLWEEMMRIFHKTSGFLFIVHLETYNKKITSRHRRILFKVNEIRRSLSMNQKPVSSCFPTFFFSIWKKSNLNILHSIML